MFISINTWMRESISFRNGIFPPDAIRISQLLAVGFTVAVRVLPAKLNCPCLKAEKYKAIFYINVYIYIYSRLKVAQHAHLDEFSQIKTK